MFDKLSEDEKKALMAPLDAKKRKLVSLWLCKIVFIRI
jgi:hypothetical protein